MNNQAQQVSDEQHEKLVNKDVVQGLTDEQINKIVPTIERLAKATNNPLAITLAHNLKMCKDNIFEKRKWIVLFYTDGFQLLSFINMAMNDKRTFEDYLIELDKLFRK